MSSTARPQRSALAAPQYTSEELTRTRRSKSQLHLQPGLLRIGDQSLQSERAGDVDPAETAKMDPEPPRVGVARNELDEAVLEDPCGPEPQNAERSRVRGYLGGLQQFLA